MAHAMRSRGEDASIQGLCFMSDEKQRRDDRHHPPAEPSLARRIAEVARPFTWNEDACLHELLERADSATIVLLGEATHGTSEFYRMRDRITRALIEEHGFDLVAVEADWPDAARIDHFVRALRRPPAQWQAFARFPAWMWRNEEVRAFVHWLRAHNQGLPPERRVGFHGLDLYSMYTSIAQVLQYLDAVDPASGRIARERYGCLAPWRSAPLVYGRAALSGRYRACEDDVVATLRDLLDKRAAYTQDHDDRFLDAVRNAQLVVNAERYYRAMYHGSAESWNLRDEHMFDTLRALLGSRGPGARAVVWAHNSHIGDASATAMAARGEHSVGQLCREHYAERAYCVGFGTHTGTVAAASRWDGPMEVKRVVPSHPKSYERLCHDSGVPAFLLPLRGHGELRRGLLQPRLERAIGVLYLPETELASHYFSAVLPRQFDEYVWFDETSAVTPLDATRQIQGVVPDTYPFAL